MENTKYNVSSQYWEKLSEKDRDLYRTISPLVDPKSAETIFMSNLPRKLAEMKEDAELTGGTFDLTPDFQRSNDCWSREQQISYIENVFRGIAPTELKFNSDNYNLNDPALPENFVCIDGLQRITAILSFLNEEYAIFSGKITASSLKGTTFDPKLFRLQIKMYNFTERNDLLNFYIKLNSGGTVHTSEEIDRVKQMII